MKRLFKIKSMEWQLQLGLAIFLALLTIIIWGAVNRSFYNLAEEIIVSRLIDDSKNMLDALDPNPNNTKVRWRRINSIYNEANSGHYYQYNFSDGRVIPSPSLWDKSLEVSQLQKGDEKRYQIIGPHGENLQVWSKQFSKGGYDFTLSVAADMASVTEYRQRFKHFFFIILMVGFSGALMLQGLLVRRIFRSLLVVHNDMRLVEVGERKTIRADVPSEVKPLVEGFNKLLDLLAQRLSRSRNALGNLAHVLKGPLNLLLQSLDKIEGEDAKQARQQADRIQHLISRELKRGRLAGQQVATQQFDARQEMPDMVRLLQRIHSNKKFKILYDISDDLPLYGDREDMLELLGNVLDNACKWAHSKLSVRFSYGHSFKIIIEDDGDGLKDDQLSLLAQRGVRFDEEVEGTGLGLAISRDIVGLYGGTIRFDKSAKLGGLLVEIELPVEVK